jgi:hypothetical protein
VGTLKKNGSLALNYYKACLYKEALLVNRRASCFYSGNLEISGFSDLEISSGFAF